MSGPGSSLRVTYPQAVTSVLASSEARSFLVSEGLPAEHELVDLFGPGDVVVEEHVSGRTFLFVGEMEGVERYGIDVASGEVVAVNAHNASVWHINASVMKFALSLEAFTERFPFSHPGAEHEELEQAADEFRGRLNEIDPTSLGEGPGYWNSLLRDIAMGDYSDEG